MLLLIIFITFSIQSVYSINCDGCLNGVCYTKIKLWDETDGRLIGQLAVDRTDNTLYFNYEKNDVYATAAVNIDTGAVGHVPDVDFYTDGRAVDQETRDMYMYATKPGLFKYNPVTKKTEHQGLLGASGSSLQFKELLFYSGILYGLCVVFPGDDDVRCFTKLRFEEVSEFVIVKHNHVYYRSNAKINRFNIAKNEIEYLFTNRFATLQVDKDLNVYYVHFKQVFRLDYETDQFVEVGGFVNTNIYSFLFDRDNSLVYFDINSVKRVFKLKSHPGSCSFDYAKKKIDYLEP